MSLWPPLTLRARHPLALSHPADPTPRVLMRTPRADCVGCWVCRGVFEEERADRIERCRRKSVNRSAPRRSTRPEAGCSSQLKSTNDKARSDAVEELSVWAETDPPTVDALHRTTQGQDHRRLRQDSSHANHKHSRGRGPGSVAGRPQGRGRARRRRVLPRSARGWPIPNPPSANIPPTPSACSARSRGRSRPT